MQRGQGHRKSVWIRARGRLNYRPLPRYGCSTLAVVLMAPRSACTLARSCRSSTSAACSCSASSLTVSGNSTSVRITRAITGWDRPGLALGLFSDRR